MSTPALPYTAQVGRHLHRGNTCALDGAMVASGGGYMQTSDPSPEKKEKKKKGGDPPIRDLALSTDHAALVVGDERNQNFFSKWPYPSTRLLPFNVLVAAPASAAHCSSMLWEKDATARSERDGYARRPGDDAFYCGCEAVFSSGPASV